MSNIDWLHGGADSLSTLTDLFAMTRLRASIKQETRKKVHPLLINGSDRLIEEETSDEGLIFQIYSWHALSVSIPRKPVSIPTEAGI